MELFKSVLYEKEQNDCTLTIHKLELQSKANVKECELTWSRGKYSGSTNLKALSGKVINYESSFTIPACIYHNGGKRAPKLIVLNLKSSNGQVIASKELNLFIISSKSTIQLKGSVNAIVTASLEIRKANKNYNSPTHSPTTTSSALNDSFEIEPKIKINEISKVEEVEIIEQQNHNEERQELKKTINRAQYLMDTMDQETASSLSKCRQMVNRKEPLNEKEILHIRNTLKAIDQKIKEKGTSPPKRLGHARHVSFDELPTKPHTTVISPDEGQMSIKPSDSSEKFRDMNSLSRTSSNLKRSHSVDSYIETNNKKNFTDEGDSSSGRRLVQEEEPMFWDSWINALKEPLKMFDDL